MSGGPSSEPPAGGRHAVGVSGSWSAVTARVAALRAQLVSRAALSRPPASVGDVGASAHGLPARETTRDVHSPAAASSRAPRREGGTSDDLRHAPTRYAGGGRWSSGAVGAREHGAER